MPDIQPEIGDFLVTRTSGPWLDRLAAWFIRWWTARRNTRGKLVDATVNHAATYVGPTADHPEGAIVEALRRVRYSSVNTYPDAVWSTGRLPANLTPTDAQRALIVASAKAMVGEKYNELGLLAVGLDEPRTGQLVSSKTWWVKDLDADHRAFCSQAVAQQYLDAGINLLPGRLADLDSPEDLEAILLPEPAA